MKTQNTEVKISEYPLGEKGKMAVIIGGIGMDNPKPVMDMAVLKYAEKEPINEFVEIFLDNPWVRVIIFGINDLDYKNWNPFQDPNPFSQNLTNRNATV